MRSRTELVTTTFVDSEEDYSDDGDDSEEEDWRPTASNKNGKKSKQSYQQQTQQQQKSNAGGSGGNGTNSTSAKRGRKRKGSSNTVGNSKANVAKRRFGSNNDLSDLDDKDELSDDNGDGDFNTLDRSVNEDMAGPSSQNKSLPISMTNVPSKKQFSKNTSTTPLNDSNSHNRSSSSSHLNDNVIDVLIYVKDLIGDYEKNQRLCLWRKDESNLLQKYIRVKTSSEEFLFTSSSVYSSWDDKRVTDFFNIQVQSLDTTNRRVKITDVKELIKLVQQAKERFSHAAEGNRNVTKSSSMDSIKILDNGKMENMENVGNQEKIKQNATSNILKKMHQQSTIDEDREIQYDNDDNDDDDNGDDDNGDDDNDDDDDEEVEEEDDEEEDEGDIEADDDDDIDDIEEDDGDDNLLVNNN